MIGGAHCWKMSSSSGEHEASSNFALRSCEVGKEPLLLKDHKLVVYPQRWLALAIFVSHEATNNMMWITFSPITAIASCYYGVSLFWINSLSWVFMLSYVLFLFPATWFLERFGLRVTAIVGGCLNTAGAWLRFAGSGPSSFWVLMGGHFLTSITYLLETNACSMLSAVWFPPNERTVATTTFALISAQFGVFIGLLATPLIITGGSDTDVVCNATSQYIPLEEKQAWFSVTNNQFLYYLLGQALLTTLTLPATFLIPEAPPTPPSDSAKTEQKVTATKMSLKESFLTAFKNYYFVAFVLVYGVSIASSGAYVTVFQEVLYNGGYSHYQDVIGYLGAAITLSPLVALLTASRWIDYSKKYYCTAVFACCTATVFTLLLSVCIQLNLTFYAVFAAATLTGGTLSLLGAVGLEYAVEMTYPLSEGVSASILNVTTMFFGILMIIGVGQLVEYHLALYGMYLFCVVLLVAAVTMIFIRPTLRRRTVDNTTNELPYSKPQHNIQSSSSHNNP